MAIVNSSYLLLSFLLSVSAVLFGVMFFAMRVPRVESMRQYNFARYVLAAAYLIIGVFNCYKAFGFSADNIWPDLIRILTLASASYQALLFTFTLVLLMEPAYVSIRRISIQLGTISLLFAFSLLLLKVASPAQFRIFYFAVSSVYVLQLICYAILFRKRYVRCVGLLKEFYNEDEYNRFRWVAVSFHMALSIGVIALCMTFLPLGYYKYFMPAIIFFYIYFAIKYYNYPLNFRYITSAVYSWDAAPPPPVAEPEPDPQRARPLSEKEQKLQLAIDKWVQEKQFRNTDMSRDDIAKSLGTEREYLAFFFQSRMKAEFRVWRTQLRIEEAKELLLKHPELSVSKIGEMVGISDRSNFQKKFTETVGVSPRDWREQGF